VAALVVAMSSGLIAMAARASSEGWPEAAGVIVQAESLRKRAAPLADADARAYGEALAAMESPSGAGSEQRDWAIAEALSQAAAVPLEIAERAADAAALAATVADRGDQSVRGDAAAAAVLAAGAAQAAANLVAVNLAADDERLRQARTYAEDALEAARWTLDLR
jgi:formiminotetrahydrofolate cyclodeaminase